MKCAGQGASQSSRPHVPVCRHGADGTCREQGWSCSQPRPLPPQAGVWLRLASVFSLPFQNLLPSHRHAAQALRLLPWRGLDNPPGTLGGPRLPGEVLLAALCPPPVDHDPAARLRGRGVPGACGGTSGDRKRAGRKPGVWSPCVCAFTRLRPRSVTAWRWHPRQSL